MVQELTDYITHINPVLIYLIVALVLLLESSGVPITNNILLLCTGALSSRGIVNVWILFVAALAGSVVGACLAYWLGERGGHILLRFLARRFRVEEERLLIIERWFKRAGVWMIFFSRMTPFVRPFACFPAGMSHMARGKFVWAALAGSFIWCSVLIAIGWSLGRRWELAVNLMQEYTIPTLLVVLALFGAYAGVMYLVKRHLQAYS